MTRVAAYQAPLLPCGSMEAIELIRARVDWCESQKVDVLCCPETVLGGLADNADHPAEFALNVESGQLETALAPLASDTVTAIVGFTEITRVGQLFNSAAVFHKGAVVGIYRKLYPAIRTSIYCAGDRRPVFTVRGLTFGVVICNDSNYSGPARVMAAQGATAIFVPTNCALPLEKADVVGDASNADIALARDNGLWVIRADVAGHAGDLVSYGASAIVDPKGTVLQSAKLLTEDLLVADIVMPLAKAARGHSLRAD